MDMQWENAWLNGFILNLETAILLPMRKAPLNSGLTLVELMISIAVFAIVAAGISSTTLMTSRIAYGNIYENTAYMVAQGYAEQIKSIRFNEIRVALDNPAEYDIPTESLSLGTNDSAGQLKKADPLIFGVPIEKDVVVDIEGEGEEQRERIMKMWITATGRDLEVATDCWDSIEITLDFEWQVAGLKGMNRKDGVVRLVKTNVSEY